MFVYAFASPDTLLIKNILFTLRSEKIQQSLDDTATIHMKKECISEPGSPSKFSINVNSLETSTNENDRLQMDKTNKSKGVHKRSKNNAIKSNTDHSQTIGS